MRSFAVLCVALILPPFAFALRGGADLDLGAGLRVSWYSALGPALAGLAALCLSAVGAGVTPFQRGLRVAAVLALSVVVYVCWAGPIELPFVSVTDLRRPGIAALAAVVLSLLPRSGSVNGSGGLVGIAAGFALVFATSALDMREIGQRLENGSEASVVRGRPDVLLIVVDTLRADALGLFGASPSPTPFLDKWLGGGWVWERTQSQAPWTFPSMASLMTSRYPSSLDAGTRGGRHVNAELLPAIGDSVPTLARALRQAGYVTAGFQKNPYLAAGSGIEGGFDVYELVGGDSAQLKAAAQTTNAALRFSSVLAKRRQAGDERPYFIYLHYMDPHLDYRPPVDSQSPDTLAYQGSVDGRARTVHRAVGREGGPSDEDLAQMRRLYRDEVGYLDVELRRLHDALRGKRLLGDETLVVFTADHGEQFGEHGAFEHGDLHVENVHVPVVLRGAGLRPSRRLAAGRLMDLAPTVLELVGLAALPGAEGQSRAREVSSPIREVFADATQVIVSEYGNDFRVQSGRHVLIRRGSRDQLFDVAADPRELNDLAAVEPGVLEKMRRLLAGHVKRDVTVVESQSRPIDRATREALEALGYIDD